ncbi:MAG: NADPH:quinone reductase [Micromonosporaceae bacterium]
MKAIVYKATGGSDVLSLAERAMPAPGPGEVRVKVAVSGVNPTDWKSRGGARPGEPLGFPEVVPNQDGSGVIDATGPGVDDSRTGERVWLWEAAWQRADGTAQEYVTLPASQAVPLPDEASFDLGASLGIPALTAHRCLTVADGGPERLRPGALSGQVVLVAGGAGAVGHAAIQLARWSGANVVTTVSGEEKERLARAAGAHHVVNYTEPGAAARIRRAAPDGVNIIVEVAPAVNADLDKEVIAPSGTIAVYATDGGREVTLHASSLMRANVRYQFVLVYTVPQPAKRSAVSDVAAAVADGALPVGEAAGLPLIRFTLDRTADAHDAVQNGAIGKVLIDVG